MLHLNNVGEFPLQDVGEKEGKYYAINVPLKDGVDDVNFVRMFRVVSINVTRFYTSCGVDNTGIT